MSSKADLERRAPEFNSGITYLQRIDTLVKQIHVAYIRHEALEMYKMCVSLQCELSSRLEEEEYTDLKEYKVCAKKLIELGNEDALMDCMEAWFEKQHNYAHANGLIMPDKDQVKIALMG